MFLKAMELMHVHLRALGKAPWELNVLCGAEQNGVNATSLQAHNRPLIPTSSI